MTFSLGVRLVLLDISLLCVKKMPKYATKGPSKNNVRHHKQWYMNFDSL